MLFEVTAANCFIEFVIQVKPRLSIYSLDIITTYDHMLPQRTEAYSTSITTNTFLFIKSIAQSPKMITHDNLKIKKTNSYTNLNSCQI